MDETRLQSLRQKVTSDLLSSAERISSLAKTAVSLNKTKDKSLLCLSSPKDIIKLLEEHCGLKIPLERKTHAKSTNETTLQRMFGESGHPVLKEILTVRELSKLKGTYIDATLHNSTLYTSFIAIGTVGGRRSSRASWSGVGTNLQNLPKHSEIAKDYRSCIVSRPGRIFVCCDQKGAEDWIVQGIICDCGGSSTGLNELQNGINRHRKRASFLFGKPESEIDKASIIYLLGKKVGHANNYGMRENKMSEELAKEGHSVPPALCKALLLKANQLEPDIRKVFQAYVEACLTKTRSLITPIGRRRTFLALRPYSDNSSIFRDAYSYIPQSSVGDNTGLAILYCESNSPGLVVNDGHDAVYTEVDDTLESITSTINLLQQSFDRELEFPITGLKIKIPVEFELGYNFRDMITFEPSSDAIQKAWQSAKKTKEALAGSVC